MSKNADIAPTKTGLRKGKNWKRYLKFWYYFIMKVIWSYKNYSKNTRY